MRSNTRAFEAIVDNLARIEGMRRSAMLEAFATLEQHDPELADIVVTHVGDRRRAAGWMCSTQRLLEGRTAYEALAEEDVDCVWDLLTGAPSRGIPA